MKKFNSVLLTTLFTSLGFFAQSQTWQDVGGGGVNTSEYGIRSTRCNDACTSNPQSLLNNTYDFCTTPCVS